MFAYAVRRILQFIPTILAVAFIIFLLLNVLPGNAALMAAGEQDHNIDVHYIEQMKKDWGLDKPVWLRFLIYVKDLSTGNLGLSFLRREPVGQLILDRLWPTLKLALVAMFVAVSLGIPLGFYSALRQGRWPDTFSMMGAVSGVSMPQFWLGLLLMYFISVKLRLLPPQGYGDGSIKNIILPGFTLGVAYMALLARTTRAAVVEILTNDYIRTARAKGLSELLVNRKHVWRNALILVLTTAGLQFGALMAQTVIVEKLFSWPGLGSLVVDSIFQRDIPVTQGCILAIPSLIFALAIMALLGPGLLNVFVALGFTNWSYTCRITRSQALSARTLDYVNAARALGYGQIRIMFTQVLPNIVGPILVIATLGVAWAILLEASLSFLGLGVQPPTPSWGGMLSASREQLFTAPWISIFPGLAIFVTVLGLNLLGDGLRDILDPHTTYQAR